MSRSLTKIAAAAALLAAFAAPQAQAALGDSLVASGGDIIIRFDNDEIADLQGMTNALRTRKPGESVKIAVLRDGKEVVVNAVLGRRSN